MTRVLEAWVLVLAATIAVTIGIGSVSPPTAYAALTASTTEINPTQTSMLTAEAVVPSGASLDIYDITGGIRALLTSCARSPCTRVVGMAWSETVPRFHAPTPPGFEGVARHRSTTRSAP